jgi:Spy/CpxP family protein refolding chaperone
MSRGRLALGAAVAVGLAMVLAAPVIRAADPAPGGSPLPGDGRTPEQLRREVVERMRTLRAWKIIDELKLDQATAARLFPLLSKYDDRAFALMKEKQEIVRDLRAETEAATPNNAKLTADIERLLGLRAKMQALQDEKIREVRRVLTPAQQAKLVLLLPRIERGFIHRIREASEDQRRPGSPFPDRRRDDDDFDF